MKTVQMLLRLLGLTVEVCSDVFAGEIDEDGECPDYLMFYVTITTDRGDRWASKAGWVRKYLTDGQAEANAEALAKQVELFLLQGHRPKDSAKWVKARPFYGSQAWAAYGEADQVRDEKIEDGLVEGRDF